MMPTMSVPKAVRFRGLLFAALLAVQFGGASAASAADCPASINEALVVSDVDRSREVPPSELDRPFPDIPDLLVPGDEESDALRIRSIAEVPVDTSLIVAPGDTSDVDADHDLRVTIAWGDTVLADGSYRDVVGKRFDLGTLAPGKGDVLKVEVSLRWIDEWNNDTQDRRWPLKFNLGVASDCDADAKDNATSDDSSRANPNGNDKTDGTSTDSGVSSRASTDAVPDDSSARASANDSGNSDGGGNLPRTGFTSGLLVVIAGSAVILGLALIVSARRRKRQ